MLTAAKDAKDAAVSASDSVPQAKSSKKRKSMPRVKYWTLPTVSSGTFDPRFLTERQQLQYLAAQKERAAEDSGDAELMMLEMSPLRLDRIKLEEMRSMKRQGGGLVERPSLLPKKAKVPASLDPSVITLSSPVKEAKRHTSDSRMVLSSPIQPKTTSRLTAVETSLRRELFKASGKRSLSSKSFQESLLASQVQCPLGASLEENSADLPLQDPVPSTDAAPVAEPCSHAPVNPAVACSSMLPASVCKFLSYTNELRKLHMEALLRCIATRKHLPLDGVEMQKRRSELLNKK